jgi:hypothetical protein
MVMPRFRHPELQEGETCVANLTREDFEKGELFAWKTRRLGQVAYYMNCDHDDQPIPKDEMDNGQLFPVFAQISELVAAGKPAEWFKDGY